MAPKYMKSNEVRIQWRDVLDHVRAGGTVIVEHYNRPVAQITPYAPESVAIPQIVVADLRALLDGTSTTPVLYVDHESDERELTVWDEALVSHHHIVISKNELIEAFEATNEITDDDLEEAIENWRLQDKVDAIVAKHDSTQG